MNIIEKALSYFETGQRPTQIEPGEPTEVYDLIDRLKNQNPKYALDWWAATTEFVRSKLIRSNALPEVKDSEKDIKIRMYDNKGELEDD